MRGHRFLAMSAGVLMLASLYFPYWAARMYAPPYPEGPKVFYSWAWKYQGDLKELEILSKLVGLSLPLPPIPPVGYVVIPTVIVALAVLALAGSVWPALLRWVAGAAWTFMLGLLVTAQIVLYRFGHTVDPGGPLRSFVEPFTPPVIGVVTVRSVKVYHLPQFGAILFAAAALLLVLAARRARRAGMAAGSADAGEGGPS